MSAEISWLAPSRRFKSCDNDTTEKSRDCSGRDTMIEIDEELCKGCGICTSFCPMKVLETSDCINKKGYYVPKAVKEDECVGCRLCELLCPEFAITVVNE